MLFNSFEFIFLFLPICLLGYGLLGSMTRPRAAIAWLVLCSVVYYGWWKPPELPHWTARFLFIMLGSVALNFALGRLLIDLRTTGTARAAILASGVLLNFGLLAYFKYTGFLLRSANLLLGAALPIPAIVLPLAFSFHTFQQHAYLVDAYHRKAGRYALLDYALFVLFFPQLLAGPIVHHHEMLPQFASHRTGRLRARNLAIGISIFIIGLLKKVLLADRVAPFVAPVFDAAAQGRHLTFGDAWLGALSFTFQLYFDFSGYCDMAIGAARMLGIRLPLNFNSPYKAGNIIDFWRRWHMTLSRWLRDYVYIPLGGNRRGEARRWNNLMITMLIGGLWHGAGWTFVFWGGLHGAYLCINHAWRRCISVHSKPLMYRIAAGLLTFLAVVAAWVFFRAADFHAAWRIVIAMTGTAGFELKSKFADQGEAILLSMLLAIVWLTPNTQQIMSHCRPALGFMRSRRAPAAFPQWRPSLAWAIALAIAGIVAVTQISHVREFIYYQF